MTTKPSSTVVSTTAAELRSFAKAIISTSSSQAKFFHLQVPTVIVSGDALPSKENPETADNNPVPSTIRLSS